MNSLPRGLVYLILTSKQRAGLASPVILKSTKMVFFYKDALLQITKGILEKRASGDRPI